MLHCNTDCFKTFGLWFCFEFEAMIFVFQASMDKFGCTSPFGQYLDNICTNSTIGKQAFHLFEKLSNERLFIAECPYPCKFLKARFL